MAAPLLAACLLGAATAQQAGLLKPEEHPPIAFATCTKAGGCVSERSAVTMDAQWRWLHDARKDHYGNCIQGASWDSSICTEPKACAGSCALEGMDASAYASTYGVTTVPGGVRLKFKNGESIGSRLYMMENETTYKMFKLLNREFTFDVDVSTLECGLNGAVYFVEMQADGGLGIGNDTAGAKYGTGYCDAQCPHDLKFISGEANLRDWHQTKTGPIGHYGSCCSEMDIWEANFAATAYTVHSCETEGPLRCEGGAAENACGDTPEDCKCCGHEGCSCCGRYKGVCDKDGCDYNTFRLGNESFFGKGPQFAVDSTKPMTVVTQFLTSDGTDSGDLVEIRRLYVQGGKVIQNSAVANLGGTKGDSITDKTCAAQKKVFDNPDDFSKKGGLKAMGKSLARGMVLVLSLWDDMLTRMLWLDSATPTDQPERYPLTKPGVRRGPCSTDSGDPSQLRAQHPDAHVAFSNVMVGEIGSTYGAAAEKVKGVVMQPAPTAPAAAASAPSTQPTAAPMPASVPAPDGLPAGSQGSPVLSGALTAMCCSAASNPSDPCGSCYVGAAQSSGFCVESKDQCTGHCSGAWCPSGVTGAFVDGHGRLAAAPAPHGASAGPVAFVASLLVLPGLGAVVWVRRTFPRSRADTGLVEYERLHRPECTA